MNLSKILTTLAFLFAFSISTQANSKSPVVRDGSIDAGARIMKVHCPSGNRTTVRLYIEDFNQYKNGQTCIYKKDGSSLCEMEWNLDEAAVTACNQ